MYQTLFIVSPLMELKEQPSSDRSWVWQCPMDYAEEQPLPETFAIRFANPESKWMTFVIDC